MGRANCKCKMQISCATNPLNILHCSAVPSKPIQKIRKIFRQLPFFSVLELCETAEALIAPVRLGIARPSATFVPMPAYAEAPRGSDELFNVEPMAERRRGRHRRETHLTGASSQGDSDPNPVPFDEEFPVVIPPDVSVITCRK